MDVPAHFSGLLEKYDLPPDALKVEITETSYASDESIRRRVDVLRQMGLQVMLDDFGSGYSSLSTLHSLEVDAMKIDMKFL